MPVLSFALSSVSFLSVPPTGSASSGAHRSFQAVRTACPACTCPFGFPIACRGTAAEIARVIPLSGVAVVKVIRPGAIHLLHLPEVIHPGAIHLLHAVRFGATCVSVPPTDGVSMAMESEVLQCLSPEPNRSAVPVPLAPLADPGLLAVSGLI